MLAARAGILDSGFGSGTVGQTLGAGFDGDS
jgi:hypothetical protein